MAIVAYKNNKKELYTNRYKLYKQYKNLYPIFVPCSNFRRFEFKKIVLNRYP